MLGYYRWNIIPLSDTFCTSLYRIRSNLITFRFFLSNHVSRFIGTCRPQEQSACLRAGPGFGVVSARSVLSWRYDCAYAYLFRGHALRALLIFLLTSELVGRRGTVLGKRLRQIGQIMKDSKVAEKVVEF